MIETALAALLLDGSMTMMVLFFLVTVAALAYGAWRLSRARRGPGFWEGGLLWLVSLLVVVLLIART